jgi:mono/diheme cytochrome c family protein
VKLTAFWLSGLGLCTLALTAACAQTSSPTDERQIKLGRQVYTEHCAACHGLNGEGEDANATGRNAQGFYPAPPHDDTGHTWHHPDSQLRQVIKEGMPEMPGFFATMPAFGAKLSDKEVDAVLAYIKTLWSDEHRQLQADISARSP